MNDRASPMTAADLDVLKEADGWSERPPGVLPTCPHCGADLRPQRSIRDVVYVEADMVVGYQCAYCLLTWARGAGPRWPDHYEEA